jgi:hypothetical protein
MDSIVKDLLKQLIDNDNRKERKKLAATLEGVISKLASEANNGSNIHTNGVDDHEAEPKDKSKGKKGKDGKTKIVEDAEDLVTQNPVNAEEAPSKAKKRENRIQEKASSNDEESSNTKKMKSKSKTKETETSKTAIISEVKESENKPSKSSEKESRKKQDKSAKDDSSSKKRDLSESDKSDENTRKVQVVEATLASQNDLSASEKKKRFQRVDEEKALQKAIIVDNRYEAVFGASGYGAKANEKLKTVRGKDFRHEKTKKKRGSYRGGAIDDDIVRSVEFSDDE